MSISIILIPLVIALVTTTAATTKTAAVVAVQNENKNKGQPVTQLAPILTIFNDITLLEQTLREHGLSAKVISDNQLICQAGEACLDYSRQTAGEPFWVMISGVKDIGKFISEMECFEKEYKQNVQSYTYNKLKKNLSDRYMKVAEETLLEDNSILLTIDI